jgi:glycosyltransferase involved in cell wall biosynthesis
MDKTNPATLGLCMIAKNEEKDLPRCLRSVREVTDEIVVVDTGSTDRTVDIAKSFGASVYEFPWENNFSSAKNFALSKSSCDWVLLLDADEELEPSGGQKVLDFIRTTDLDGAHFTIVNYMGKQVSDNYMLHLGFRLLRNNGAYQFSGEIHEQITLKDGGRAPERFTTLDAKIYHYGYLEQEMREKKKHDRNVQILEKQLARNPEEGFTLFNLGNEYLTEHNVQKALKLYEKADRKKVPQQAYVPHLLFRMANCYENLLQYDRAVKKLDEGLRLYPQCTDFEFLRACILRKAGRISMAIESYEKCMRMGEPPLTLKFLEGCSTYRPAFLLGDLYFELCDYDNALKYYTMAMTMNPKLQETLYRIGTILNHQYPDHHKMYEQLYSRFADRNYEPNVIVAVDILLNERLYAEALEDLKTKPRSGKYGADFLYLSGKANFLTKNDLAAYADLDTLLTEHAKDSRVLANTNEQGSRLLFAACLAGMPKNIPHSLEFIQKFMGGPAYKACRQLSAAYSGTGETILTDEDDGEAALSVMMQILDLLLKAREYDAFCRLLPALNAVNSKNVLLRLSEVYHENGIRDMAVKNVLRSIRELDAIDAKGVEILYRDFARPPAGSSA